MATISNQAPLGVQATLVNATKTFEEGCLSIPETFVEVSRPAAVKLRWQDLQGSIHEAGYEGLMATALQHEFDHLQGKLFIDLLKPMKQRMLKRRLKKRAQRKE